MLQGISGDFRFILASASPRRRQLLEEAGLKFEVVVREYNEKWPEDLTGSQIAEYLSEKKAGLFRDGYLDDKTVLITADTIVWCEGSVMDKPVSYGDAFTILRKISGKTHEVITGVTLLSRSEIHTFSESTRVSFDHLSDIDIDYYIRNYKPYDKAGAYGIQEWIGIVGITSIEGSYFNVMGLPVNRLIRELRYFTHKIMKKNNI